MSIGDNFDKLTDSIKEYVNIKTNAIKLSCVENLSLFSSDILSILIVFFFSTSALFFALFAIMILMARYIGLFYGSLVISVALIIAALVVYLLRKQLFANMFVSRFSKMFFDNDTEEENKRLFKDKES